MPTRRARRRARILVELALGTLSARAAAPRRRVQLGHARTPLRPSRWSQPLALLVAVALALAVLVGVLTAGNESEAVLFHLT